MFDELMDVLFDKNKGLGLTVVRYNIGGTQPNVTSVMNLNGAVSY